MRFSLLIMLLFSLSLASAQTPKWINALRTSNGGTTNLQYHTVDKKGNSYFVGNFSGTITIDTQKFTASGQDVYVTKFSNAGKLEWVTTFGGNSTQEAIQLSPDKDGNVYVAGSFFNGLKVGDSTYTSGGSYDAFLVKLDKNGKPTWSQVGTGSNQQRSKSVEVDDAGNVYWMGDYAASSVIAEKSLSAPGGNVDVFLAKLTSKGYLIRVAGYGGSNFDQSFDIALSGKTLYIGGLFFNAFKIGTTSVSGSGGYDIFYARFDSTLSLSWLKSAGSFSGDNLSGMSANSKGELFLTGTFSTSFSIGSKSLSGTWGDVFIARVAANSTVVYATALKGPASTFSQIYPKGIHGLDDGSVYLGGHHSSSLVIGSKSYSVSGSSDVFVVGYDNKGAFQWINRGGNNSAETTVGFSVDSVGYYYVGGFSSGSTKFGTITVNGSGFYNNFVAQGTKPISVPRIIGVGARYVYVDSTLSRSYMDTKTQAEYSLLKGPKGMTLTKDSAKMLFTPDNSQIGRHLVLIKAENIGGEDKDSFPVFVIEPMKASLSIPEYGCEGIPIRFEQADKSVGPLKVTWEFGDGTSSVSENFSKTYKSVGTYYIKMKAINGFGVVDSLFDTITIARNPVAKFNLLKACTQDTLTLSDSSLANTGKVILRNWYENGSILSSTDSILKLFKSTKDVIPYKLIVTTDRGCMDSITRFIRISDKPKADYSSFNACAGDDALFFDESDAGTDTIAYYVWDFGDNSTLKTSAPGAIHKYDTGGVYQPTLTVVTINGCSSNKTSSVSVYAKPLPAFEAQDICLGVQIEFKDLSTSPGATLNQRRWTTGDGKSFSNPNFKYTYKTPGSYTITLVVANSNGCSDTLKKKIVVATKAVAGFDVSLPCEYQSATFNDTSKLGSLDSYEYRKWFLDGTFINDLSNFSTTLQSTSDPVEVAMVIATRVGCYDSVSTTITPLQVVAADFSLDSGCDGDTLPIVNSIDTLALERAEWVGIGTQVIGNKSDGWKAVLTDVQNAQLYLRTTSKNGCQDSIVKPVEVFPIPLADFSYTLDSSSRVVTFTADQTTADDYIWDLGLGKTDSTQINTIDQKYEKNNTYKVSLTVEENGCSAIVEQTLDIDIDLSANKNIFLNQFSFFPNPVKDVLNIQSTSGEVISTWEIRSLTGQHLQLGNGNTVETAQLSPGVYLLQLNTESGSFQYRFSKTN